MHSVLANFPKRFDSESYSGDIDKALRRAKAAYHAALGDMYAVDDRMMQTAILMSADGFVIDRETIGAIAEPEPNE